MNPAEDTFLTASKDRTVRLWNLQQAGCIGQMDLPPTETKGQPHVVFDSTGLVFGVTAEMAGGQGNVSFRCCCFLYCYIVLYGGIEEKSLFSF